MSVKAAWQQAALIFPVRRSEKAQQSCWDKLGIYFLGVFIYLFKNAVIPITAAGEWRTFVDVLAVGFYLFGVVPLFGISLLEIGVIGRGKTEIFLVVAHIAMIFGMVNPDIFSGAGQMKM